MKTFIVNCIFCIVLVSQPIAANPSVYSKVKMALASLKQDKEFGVTAQRALRHLPYCNQILQEALFSNRGNLDTIDIILYEREPATYDPELLLKSKQSNIRVEELLDSLQYPVIGYEGTFADSVTIDWLVEYFWKEMLAQGLSVEQDSIRDQVINSLLYDGVFSYLMLRSHSPWVVGIQDPVLSELYSDVCFATLNTPTPRKDLVAIKPLLERFRCELAIARVLQAMVSSRPNTHRAVMVIGYLNLQYLQEFLQLLQIKSTVYDARNAIPRAVP